MKGTINLIFDWRSIGFIAYVPVVACMMIFLYTLIVHEAIPFIIPALEFSIPVFAAWWSIFLFYDVLEEPGNETIFTYPLPRWKLGIARVGSFYLFYLVLIAIMLFAVNTWTAPGIFLPMYIQLVVQSFFFSALGFFSMIMTLNTGWALMVVIVYSSTQILTRGELLPLLNIYLFNEEPLSMWEFPFPLILALTFGIVFMWISQYMLSHMRRFH